MLSPRPAPEQIQARARRAADLKVVQQARKLYFQRLQYPNSPGHQEHHFIPIYLGGARNDPTYRLPTAYHKAITQEFRQRWEYGRPKPRPEVLQAILVQVYSRYPIPQLIGLQP